jgi:Tol biopolymer transport system component
MAMKRMLAWWKGLLALVAVVAFALALAWLLRAAQPQGAAGPPPTFALPPTAEPTTVPPTEALATEITPFVPGRTSSPIITVTLPVPTPTSPPGVAGMIVYRAGARGEERLYQLAVDGQGQPVGLPVEIPGSLHLDGPFHLSSDQKRLAVRHRTEGGSIMYILDLAVGQIRPLLLDGVGSPGTFLNWHPNGSEVLYATMNGPNPGLWLVSINTSDHVILATEDQAQGQIDSGAISPDGQQVIFSAWAGFGADPKTWKVNTDGTGLQLLSEPTGQPILEITWSPDGTQIAYLGDGLSVMDSDGQSQRILSQRFYWGFGFYPVWSLDSRTIAFVGREPPLPEETEPLSEGYEAEALRGNICLVDVATGQERLLVPGSTEGNIDPVWSPDGSRIAFVSNRSGTPEIWVINADGSGLRQITNDGTMKRYPTWVQR